MQHSLANEIKDLTDNYLTNVYPFESLARAIAMQEQELI